MLPQSALVFFGIAFLLFSLSAGSIQGMGYTKEQMDAGLSLLHRAHDLLTSQPSTAPLMWSRHGVFPLLFDAPFLIAGGLFEPAAVWRDRLLTLRPILFTAGIGTIFFRWLLRITGKPLWSFVFCLLAVLSTILWPYAYIGLEDAQSFFLFLAAFLAFTTDPGRSWWRTAAFACAAASALCCKMTGTFLIPAVAFLIFVAFRRYARKALLRVGLISGFLAAVFFLNTLSRAPYWKSLAYAAKYFRFWLVEDPIYYAGNFVSFFFAPNKGLLFYCPLLFVALVLLHTLWKEHRHLFLFSLLVIFGLAGGFSFIRVWSDETWGPRYLHPSIAPLLLCVGAASAAHLRRSIPLIAATAVIGLAVNFLGAIFPYGLLHGAMTAAGQDTLEAIQSDPVWNPIRFHVRLLSTLIARPKTPVLLVPAHQWYYDKPPASTWQPVEISRFAVPQPYLIRFSRTPLSGSARWYWLTTALSLPIGILLLTFAATRIKSGNLRYALPSTLSRQ